MVKKLWKHEFKAWLRVVPFFWLAMVGIATAGRIVQFFETDSVYYRLLFGSAIVTFVVAAVVVLLAPTVFGVYRFYRNLFTGEGYLSFILPVTVGQHLWVKVTTAVCFSLGSALVLLLSGMLLISGEVLTEVWKAASYLWREVASLLPGKVVAHLVGYLVEGLLILIVGLFGGHLMYQSCVCIGQLANKNRVLLAVGAYFGYQLISQILSTVVTLGITMMGMTGALDGVVVFIEDHPFGFFHILMCGSLVFSLLLTGLFWWICYRIMRKRLNLE